MGMTERSVGTTKIQSAICRTIILKLTFIVHDILLIVSSIGAHVCSVCVVVKTIAM